MIFTTISNINKKNSAIFIPRLMYSVRSNGGGYFISVLSVSEIKDSYYVCPDSRTLIFYKPNELAHN